MLPVAILAGGLATRLGPLTQTTPKALLEVGGRPFIAWQLEMLAREGVERVVLCIKHLGSRIRDFVGDGRTFGLEVEYSEDGDRLLGTGGALRAALFLLGKEFFVMYGDSYLTINLARVEEAFRAQRKAALMAVLRNEDRWDKSNVWLERGRIRAYSKKSLRPEMRHIDYGLGVLTAGLFERAGLAEAFDLSDLYEVLAAEGNLGCYEATDRFYEIGSFDGLREANAIFREGRK